MPLHQAHNRETVRLPLHLFVGVSDVEAFVRASSSPTFIGPLQSNTIPDTRSQVSDSVICQTLQ
ncbi:hypothetical protein J6590_037033 [Homalodisca vitripennis]|nr:hypothetical protein J6590_037033 [Homalodisca vitripennis]